ncbi:unnamed protein product, partial [Rotaria magnacalcarata]
HTITSTLACSGNRRGAMNNEEQGTIRGAPWYVGAIGNARWTGVRLRDVLQSLGLDKEGKYVQFYGLDCETPKRCYGGSIPIEKALNHGYPLRIIVPGSIGARSVKWVNRIVVSDKESDSPWQIFDYKLLPTSVKQPQKSDYDAAPAIQDLNVNSAICYPSSNEDGNKVKILSVQPNHNDIKNKKLTIKGYALSGGGKQIQNVQVSLDHGKTWLKAELEQLAEPHMRAWTWTQWTYHIPFDDLPSKPFDIICRATDTNANSQPESPVGIWNVLGHMNNAWHKITLQIDEKCLKKGS